MPRFILKWRVLRFVGYASIILFVFLHVLDHHISDSSEDAATPQHIHTNTSLSVDVNEYLNVRLNHEWILNNNILQYSSYIVHRPNLTFIIEAIILPVEFRNTPKWKCILKQPDGHFDVYSVKEKYEFYQVISYTANKRVRERIRMYRVKCGFQSVNSMSPQTLIAIIDQNDFDLKNAQKNENLKMLSYFYLKFQLPHHINATQVKQQANAHCIHMMYDLEFEDHTQSLSQFFDMQIDLGIIETRMYIYRHHSQVDLNLKEKFTKFLTIVHHDCVHHRVCQLEIYNLAREPLSSVYQHMYDQCLHAFRRFFQIIEVARIKSIHDNLNINDCYINFRYLYEIVTNYDFDEFIWPRKSKMGEIQTYYNDMQPNLQSFCTYRQMTINAYEHRKWMFNEYDVRQKGVLRTSHAVMFGFTDNMDRFFGDLEYLIVSMMNNPSNSVSLAYKDFNRTLEFVLEKTDYDYARQLVQYYKLARRMYDYLKKTNVRFNFNRAVVLQSPVRLGKSIFHTDKCELLNAHNADLPRVHAHLTYNQAFVSHFREYYEPFLLNKTITIQQLFVDLEYYHYLFKKFASSEC